MNTITLKDFIEIPAGPFTMGSAKGEPMAYSDEYPQHEVNLPNYWMAKTTVTESQYSEFLSDTNSDRTPPTIDRDDLPMTKVSYHDAVEYCKWLNIRLVNEAEEALTLNNLAPEYRALCEQMVAGTLRVTLPSEAEWEKAARGTDGRRYPWGDDPDPKKANYVDSGHRRTMPVGQCPQGASPYGIHDMAGNVWEWTRSEYKPYPQR